jgi:hypothetical protein
MFLLIKNFNVSRKIRTPLAVLETVVLPYTASINIFMEYVYKLHLQPIYEIVNSVADLENSCDSEIDKTSSFGMITYPDPDKILKPSHREYLGFLWNRCSLHFKGPQNQGTLHRDNWRNASQLIWALNWVWGDDSIIEYWENDLIKDSCTTIDGGGSFRVQAVTDHFPSKVYKMPVGIYLVNASVYHRVTNIGKNIRYALSFRSMPNRYFTWELAVNHFKKYFE